MNLIKNLIRLWNKLAARQDYRFTPRAQTVLALARQESNRLRNPFLGTEHLLLGLVELGQGVGMNVINNMGLTGERIRMEVEKRIHPMPDQPMIGNPPYTARVKKVLALAAKEAARLKQDHIGTEAILLGLISEGDGVAARVLQNLGLNIEQTREEVLKELTPIL